jgi:uncharacterized protein YuzE
MTGKVKIRYDAEGDYLEVLFSDAPGYMRSTDNDAVMERLDAAGKVTGFTVMQVSRLSREAPLIAELTPSAS